MPNPTESFIPVPAREGVPSRVPPAAQQFRCSPWVGAVVALLGGLLTWAVLERLLPVFQMPPELSQLQPPVPVEKMLEVDRAMARAARGNAVVAMAVLGFVLGGFLATAETFARRRWLAAVWTVPLAGIVAGLCGAGAGLLGAAVLEGLQSVTGVSPLAKTTASQAALLGLFGLGLGAGVGLPYANPRLLLNSVLGGVLSGGLLALIYPAGVGYLLPIAQTERLFPDAGLSRLIWLAAIGALSGTTLTGLGRRRV